jgi:molybdate/tungstate transport system substrate-binding protein
MASADSAVIRNLLMPEYANYCIDFAGNEMVVMYGGKSRYADEIAPANWIDILLRPGVQIGHSDPNSDPCGYRAILVMKLVEKHYQRPGWFQKIKGKIGLKNIRPKEVDLLALLEHGELDYIFIYRSVAVQHDGRFLRIPAEINLGSPQLRNLYETVSVTINGKKPGEWLEKAGAPMVYGITVPTDARHQQWGIRFIEFLLADEGRSLMEQCGQPVLTPPRVDYFDRLPPRLRKFFDGKQER